LLSLAKHQAESVAHDKPTEKFICKLFSLLESGRAYLTGKDHSCSVQGIGFIGYEDETYLYLIPDIAHKMVRQLCEEQGESFAISSRILLKQLGDENLIEIGSNNERTKSLRVGNKHIRVMYLYREKANQIAGIPP